MMWERWKAGWTLHQIGHLFDRPHTSIHNVLSRTGGIRPPERRRSKAALSLNEREEISRALVAGETLGSIAVRLGRAPSTVSRETVAEKAIELRRLIAPPGIGHFGLSAVSLRRRTAHWQT